MDEIQQVCYIATLDSVMQVAGLLTHGQMEDLDGPAAQVCAPPPAGGTSILPPAALSSQPPEDATSLVPLAAIRQACYAIPSQAPMAFGVWVHKK